MMSVYWLEDSDLITETIRHPKIYPFVSDDTCPKAEDFNWPIAKEFTAVGCYDDEIYFGCFCFYERSKIETEIHTCLLPSAKGIAKFFVKLVVDFVMSNTDYDLITTFIPKSNSLAKNLALKCCFVFDGDGDGDGELFGREKTEKFIFKRSSLCL
jgi:hypothetical protein